MAASDNSTSSLNLQFEDIEEMLEIHINLTAPAAQIFAMKERAIDGKYYRLDFQTAGNSYTAARFRGAFQPGYNRSSLYQDGFAQYSVSEMLFFNTFLYHSLDFTGQMKTAVKSRKGGYQNLVDFRFDDTTKHMEEQIALRMVSSQYGTRGIVQAVSSPTVTLRYAGYSPASTTHYPEAGSTWLRTGQKISAASSRTAALRQGTNDLGREILSMDLDNAGSSSAGPTLTLDSTAFPTTWAAGDFITILDERLPAAISGDPRGQVANMVGLLDAVDDGDYSPYYGGLLRSSNQTLNALVNDNGSSGTRDLTQQLLNVHVELINQISGGQPNIFYSRPGVQRRFVNHLTLQGSSNTSTDNPMRYGPSSKQQIGFNSFDVYPLGLKGQLRFMPDRMAPQHTGFLLEQGSGIFLRDGPPGFMDGDGNKIRKVVGLDQYTADWKMTGAGIVMKAPWRNGRFDDLAGDHMTA